MGWPDTEVPEWEQGHAGCCLGAQGGGQSRVLATGEADSTSLYPSLANNGPMCREGLAWGHGQKGGSGWGGGTRDKRDALSVPIHNCLSVCPSGGSGPLRHPCASPTCCKSHWHPLWVGTVCWDVEEHAWRFELPGHHYPLHSSRGRCSLSWVGPALGFWAPPVTLDARHT